VIRPTLRPRAIVAVCCVATFSLLAACSDSSSSSSPDSGVTTDGSSPDGTSTDGTGTGDTSGGSGTDSTDPNSTNPSGGNTGGTTVDGGTTGTPDGTAPVGTGPGADTDFCKLQSTLNQTQTPFDDPASTADDFKTYFAEVVVPAIEDLRTSAPDEIKDDMEVLAAGLQKFATAFEKNGWDPAKAYADPELQALANDADYNAAGEAVDQFCGFPNGA
jgi:hypothetical protein